jgi:uncharacterized membrane protein
MTRTLTRIASLLGATLAAALVIAPVASAASTPSCLNTGGSTNCQAPGNVQIYASPHALSAAGSHSDPKWSGLGYNPKWNGFHH